ncbi:DUF5623 domain-containing protein [Sphingobium subterraneum]|uniref:DUF5623 domain-containing protein n=1 Tax=Sphingobium subterraneum TaxID=627688 RepID=A0A841J4I8_9SPHN|nr:DUF5623 domain-containing protein [Sphingobium subterraneum]MBB6125630.1 hypothetical protein [Sphingobium subterraneum]
MSIAEVRPSNLANIKRLANQLKKNGRIQHREALNAAARRAGFQNFEHARRMTGVSPSRLLLTGYWEDRETFEIGRETLAISIPCAVLEMVSKAELRIVGGLSSMRIVAPDHMVIDSLGHSRDYIRDELCRAARAMQFMNATGLRPCRFDTAERVLSDLDEELPGKDHSSHWYDPKSGQFILIDEPYSRARVSSERADWSERNDWNLSATSWPGLYFPYRCAFFVASKNTKDFDFEALLSTINAMPASYTSEDWQGQSASNHNTFFSPLATSLQDKRRAKAKGTIVARASKKTLPYRRDMLGLARKPNGRMTLEEHRQAGRMIRAVLQSNFKPWSVNRRMDEIMRVLVDWLYADVAARELDTLTDPIELYYGEIVPNDPLFLRANSPEGVVSNLADLRFLLESAYPLCAPLRKMTARIETSLKIVQGQARASAL